MDRWMDDVSDRELLRDYAERDSEAAFAALVARHVNLVYSAALRRTSDPHAAEEVAQTVFIVLARKAGRLSAATILPGWLYQTTRLTAASYLRRESRRARREQEAFMRTEPSETEEAWARLAPWMEDAMGALGEKDRSAILLRFFGGKSFAEVGTALRVSENAAKKRVGYALEKMRRYFARRGVSLSTPLLVGAITAHSVQAAPVVVASAVVAAVAQGAVAGVPTLAQTVMAIMAWSKAKMAVGLGVLLVAGAGTVGVKDTLFAREPSYQGKRLSQWLVEVNYGQPDEARARAGEAIRKMGAKTLPILLDYYRDPVATHRRLGYVDPLAADDRLRQVTWAFKALGPIAIPAIPRLTHLLERHPGYVPGALAGVGPAALPELFDALTNRSWSFWVRDNTAPYLCNAIYSDTMTPEQLRGVLPIALANLSDTNANPMYRNNTRRHAADLLRALQLEPEVCVPALIQGMADTNVYVVEACAEALGSFGKHAESARPLIEQAAGSTNAQLRATAQRVLERLDQAR